jgi:hypothetical protein
MACRGCSSDGCSCSVTGDGVAISVTGSGTPVTSPYVVAFSIEDALADITIDDVTACDVLNDPHVPVLLGDGSVVSVPLPCLDAAPTPALPGQAFAFTWDSAVTGTPADGYIQFNNATYTSVTEIHVNEQEHEGTDISAWLTGLNTITGSPKGMVKLYLRSNPAIWATYFVTDVVAGAAGDVTDLVVTYVDHTGAFSGAILGDTVLDFAPASQGSVGGFDSVQVIEAVTGAYTLDIADAGKYLRCANAAPFSVTVPLNATVAFTIGTHIDLIQSGAGQVTIAATGGVTINAAPGLKLNGQWAGATLVKVGTNEWDLVGNLTA